MAENKIQIQAQVNIASGPAEVARLNKQLADLAKKLKLTINDVNIAGTKMASGTSQATQKATQAMSKYELELNKVLHAYKMKQTADEKFVQTAERMMKSDKFKELSAKKQLELLNQRITAEKNLDRIYDIGIAKDKQATNQKLNNMNKLHSEALRMNKEFDNLAKTQLKTQQKIYSLASGGSSRFKPYDDYQKAATQTSMQGRLQTVQNSFASMQKNRMFGSIVSADELNTINAQMNKLQISMSKISNNKMAQKWNTELMGVKNTLGGINTQLPKSIGYFANLKNIIGKFSDWLIVSTLIFLPLRAFQKGLQTLKEIDTTLIDIAKVTDMTKQEMQALAEAGTDVASKFGRTTQDFLKSVAEFSRAGYGDSAKGLAEASMLLQNVGDISGETANEMLLAVDASYQLGGSQDALIKVIDQVNEVKFAS